MSLLEKFKKFTGESDDDICELYLERARSDIKDQTNRVELLDRMDMLVLDVALIYYSRARREGISSMSEGAISVSYFEDLSPALKSRIWGYRILPLTSDIKKVKTDEGN